MTIKAVLFDLDGTLLDSIPGILASFEHALARHVPLRQFSRQELVMVIGEPLGVQMLGFAGGDAAVADRLVADYRRHNLGLLPGMQLYPGARAALAAVRARGQRVGIVTSKARASAMVSLDGHGLTGLLDLILSCDDTTRHKPDAEPLLEAARRLALAPGEIAYVGDSVHDVRCALAAGCTAVAALWGPFERATLLALRPHVAAESLAGLAGIAELRP